MKRLLVVEDAFVVGSATRGVIVEPRFTYEDAPREKFAVRLVLPGGGERNAEATIDVPHVRGPLAPFAMLRLHGVALEDVPKGTEIWKIED